MALLFIYKLWSNNLCRSPRIESKYHVSSRLSILVSHLASPFQTPPRSPLKLSRKSDASFFPGLGFIVGFATLFAYWLVVDQTLDSCVICLNPSRPVGQSGSPRAWPSLTVPWVVEPKQCCLALLAPARSSKLQTWYLNAAWVVVTERSTDSDSRSAGRCGDRRQPAYLPARCHT